MTKKSKAAMELGRKGGNARAKSRGWENIPEKARKESARKAAQARWAKAKEDSK